MNARMQTLVAELTLKPVVVVAPDVSVHATATLLAESDIPVVVVGASPLFEVTDHDVVRAYVAMVDPASAIGELDHAPPAFVPPTACVVDVANVMLETGRHELVVSDGERAFGVVELNVVTAALWGPTTIVGALGAALHVRGIAP
jgi:CBS domain-containing protein